MTPTGRYCLAMAREIYTDLLMLYVLALCEASSGVSNLRAERISHPAPRSTLQLHHDPTCS